MSAKAATFIKMLDSKPKPRPKLSPEEQARNNEIGRRYNQMMAKQHNQRMTGLRMKMKLRDDAIANLPEMLQHAARQNDTRPPPLNRRMARYTPPIPGFNPKDYLSKDYGENDKGEA
ncbi:unnamed protein product [Choristocarpus tenellus]